MKAPAKWSVQKWSTLTSVQRSHVYAKLFFFVGTFGWFFCAEIFRIMMNPG